MSCPYGWGVLEEEVAPEQAGVGVGRAALRFCIGVPGYEWALAASGTGRTVRDGLCILLCGSCFDPACVALEPEEEGTLVAGVLACFACAREGERFHFIYDEVLGFLYSEAEALV